MIIKKFRLFENFTEMDKFEIVDLFQDIFDLEHDYFQVRDLETKVPLDKRYQKVIMSDYGVSYGVSKNAPESFVVRIWCDYSYNWQIENEIRSDIIPRLRVLGYKTALRNTSTGSKIYKTLPTSSGGTTIIGDPIHLITVTIKNCV